MYITILTYFIVLIIFLIYFITIFMVSIINRRISFCCCYCWCLVLSFSLHFKTKNNIVRMLYI